MSRRFAAPNGIGIKPGGIESRQRIALRVQHPAMFVYLQTDCRGTVARINFYGVERCLFHRSQTRVGRSEEHTSELQSLMRISYAVFCLKKKKRRNVYIQTTDI